MLSFACAVCLTLAQSEQAPAGDSRPFGPGGIVDVKVTLIDAEKFRGEMERSTKAVEKVGDSVNNALSWVPIGAGVLGGLIGFALGRSSAKDGV